MLIKARVSAAAGGRYRVEIGGQVSALLPRLQVTRTLGGEELDVEIRVGDWVLVAFFGGGLADGVVVGRITI